MGAQAVATLFPQEYLEMEATSTIKHEYYNGVLVAMAGASYEHNLITENLKGNLFSLLKGKPCRTLGADMRVKLNEEGNYIYPDITVFFGAPNLTLETPSSLLNPTLIVEVLSTSTEEEDRYLKLPRLMQLDGLEEIILVGSRRIWIEHYIR